MPNQMGSNPAALISGSAIGKLMTIMENPSIKQPRMMYIIDKITINIYLDKANVPIYAVRAVGMPRYPTPTDKKEAPQIIHIIMQLVLTDPIRASRNTFQSRLCEIQAKNTEPNTPTAAASVGVAHPRYI